MSESAGQGCDNRPRHGQEKLQALLIEAVESLERGEGIVVTPGYWKERRARLIAQFQAERKAAVESVRA